MKKTNQSRGRRRGQSAKNLSPKLSAKENFELAATGYFDESMLATVDGLERMFDQFDKSQHWPFDVLRNALADTPSLKPERRDFKSVGEFALAAGSHNRKQIIRKSIMELLKRIAMRDSKFFLDMSRLFARKDNATNCADELRSFVSMIRLTREPMTYNALENELRLALPATPFARRTIVRACKAVGYEIKKGQRGRPRKLALK